MVFASNKGNTNNGKLAVKLTLSEFVYNWQTALFHRVYLTFNLCSFIFAATSELKTRTILLQLSAESNLCVDNITDLYSGLFKSVFFRVKIL